MRIKITEPKHSWHIEFFEQEFEVTDAYNPNHPQYPVMTKYGQTWFDVDAVTVLES